MLWVALALLVMLAAVAAWRLYPLVASRAGAARAMDRLGRAQGSTGPLSGGQLVTLTGRLLARGTCDRFEDGASVAAATVALGHPTPRDLGRGVPAVHARAAELAIEIEGEVVALEGPIDVLIGSEETWAARGLRALSPT